MFFRVTEGEWIRRGRGQKKGIGVEKKFSLRIVCQNHIPCSLHLPNYDSKAAIEEPLLNWLIQAKKNPIHYGSKSMSKSWSCFFMATEAIKKTNRGNPFISANSKFLQKNRKQFAS